MRYAASQPVSKTVSTTDMEDTEEVMRYAASQPFSKTVSTTDMEDTEEVMRYAASQPVSKTVSTTDMEAMEDHLGRPVSRLQRSYTLPSQLVSTVCKLP